VPNNPDTPAICGNAPPGRHPVLARLAPDKKTLVVLNHDDATLGVYDASNLAHIATIPIVHNPDDVAILPNSSLAFVISRSEPRLSVVDLKRNVLLSNLQLVGKPSDMIM